MLIDGLCVICYNKVEQTKVVNIRKNKYEIRIDRKSIFGNPFILGVDGNRDEVIEKYKKYFYEKIKRDSDFKNKVLNLKGKILGCWCKPKECHGDIIVKYLEESD